MFLVNSRQRDFRCGPTCVGQALYRRYGRFFAEFLKDESLVPLGLLALSTCVGFRYGAERLNLEVFLERVLDQFGTVKPYLAVTLGVQIKLRIRICQDHLLTLRMPNQ